MTLLLAGVLAQADISDVLKPIREKHDLPGLAAVVVRGDKVVSAGAAGVRKKGAPAALKPTDRFHLGSCTKSMTATMIATLVAEKKMRWDLTIGEAFPDIKDMHAGWRGVTLAQLLTHRGGAPANLDADGLWAKLWAHKGTPREARRLLVEGVLRRAPEAAPGAKYIYSNAGYAIAGAMAEQVAGAPWEEVMRKRLFEPLAMKTAGFGAPGRRGAVDEPLGHMDDGSPMDVGPGSDNPPAIGPAGTVHASLPDWARYAAAHVQRRGLGLRKEDFDFLHTPARGGEDYALGWIVTEREWGGGTVLTHAGSNTMWFAVAWLAPKRDFAVLVATNQGGDKAAMACDEAASALIRAQEK